MGISFPTFLWHPMKLESFQLFNTFTWVTSTVQDIFKAGSTSNDFSGPNTRQQVLTTLQRGPLWWVTYQILGFAPITSGHKNKKRSVLTKRWAGKQSNFNFNNLSDEWVNKKVRFIFRVWNSVCGPWIFYHNLAFVTSDCVFWGIIQDGRLRLRVERT